MTAKNYFLLLILQTNRMAFFKENDFKFFEGKPILFNFEVSHVETTSYFAQVIRISDLRLLLSVFVALGPYHNSRSILSSYVQKVQLG